MKRKFIIPVVMLFSLFWSCSSGKKTEINRALTVKIDSVEPCTQQLSVSYPGKIKASSDVNLSFRVSGPLKQVYVNVGSKVKKGQLLAEIDPRDYVTQLEATKAEYNRIKGEAERIMALFEKRSVSKNDYDKAKFGLEQITAKLKAHTDALTDTKLYAPYDGFIQKRLFDRDETVGAGMPIVSMINDQMPDIEINIPSTEFYQRDLFDTFTCSVDIFPNQVYNLTLKGITHKANLNQLYTMRFTFDKLNYINLPTAGMTATVYINKKTSDSELTIIPLSAVFNSTDSQPMVWVYKPDSQTVSAREIRLTGIQRDGKTIVSNGLSVGEQVVTAGVHSLKEGDRVVPLLPASKTNIGGLL